MSDETVFANALLQGAQDQRHAYLDEACAGDQSLRARVEALLAAHEQSRGFLERPAAEQVVQMESPFPTEGNPDLTKAHAGRGENLDQTQAEGQSATVDDDLNFLRPTEQPGLLGKLGHYNIHSVIGKGGFGIVLKGFDERLHRVVAIKVLSPAYAAVGSARKRFIREARAAAAVKNEHVVGIYDVQEDAIPPYLVMELIDGVSLQEKLDRHGALGVKEILRIGLQAAGGLAAAHAQGIVHRDIKPGNILLENGVERVKITDFGLARSVDDASLTQSGTVAGTPMYMSPEQAEGLPIDHRSDLFSLGSVLYVMCTARAPFRATGTMAVLKRVIEDTPTPIREINNEIPNWLCDSIAKLHAKKPEDRFQSAKEVAELLGQRLADVQAGREIVRAGSVGDRVAPAATAAANRPLTGDGSAIGVLRPFVISLALIPVLFALIAGVVHLVGPSVNQEFYRFQKELATFLFGTAVVATALVPSAELVARQRRSTFCRALALGFAYAAAGSALVAFFMPRAPAIVVVSANHADVSVTLLREADQKEYVIRPSEELLLDPGTYLVLVRFGAPVHRLEGMIDNGATKRSFTGIGEIQEMEGGAVTLERGKRANILLRITPTRSSGNAAPDESGWVQLFNGKDLTGWKLNSADKDVWRVTDGVLIGQGAECSMLPSERSDFRDFHLRVEAMINEGGDSGVWFRTDLKSQDGYEANINHSHRDLARTGSLGMKMNHKQKWLHHQNNSLAPANTWFTLEVIAVGPNVTVKVDGLTVAQVTDSNRSAGHIGLEMFEKLSVAQFRKIEIKELPPEQPGWVQLFNGKDYSGWKLSGVPWPIAGTGEIVADHALHAQTEMPAPAEFQLRFETKLVNGQTDIGFHINDRTGWRLNLTESAAKSRAVDATLFSSINGTSSKKTGIAKPLAKLDEWFRVEIFALKKRTEVHINGTKTLELHDGAFPILPGTIGVTLSPLQPDGKAPLASFRKIEIKELPPAEPPLAVAPFDAAKAKEHQDAWAKHLGVEPEIKNSIGMKLRLIPPGKFVMGSPPKEFGRDNDEEQHEVAITKPFYLGRHEVTVGQFKKFVQLTKYKTDAETAGGAYRQVPEVKLDPEANWQNPFFEQSDDHPVVCISRKDALAFCDWLSAHEGKKYTLPTEAQWEYGCRAGSQTRFHFGDDEQQLPDYAWYFANSDAKTHRVGLKKANAWGLHDMHGNVNEWTADWYAADYYQNSPKEDPSGARAVGSRVMRGGSWCDLVKICRAARRYGDSAQQDRFTSVGFRVALVGDLQAKPPPLAELLKDAVVVMNFEKDTFYQKDGKTYVRDLSGQGHDGECDQVEYTPNGQAGGALACKGGALRLQKGLLNQLPEYTIAAWVNVDFSKETNFRLLTQGVLLDKKNDQPVFGIQVRRNNMFIDSWNRDFLQADNWKACHLEFPAVGPGWNFVAVRLRQGGVGTGELLVTRNDKTLKGDLQMLKADDQVQLLVGYQQPGKVDELVILPRALSDAELQAIYEQGLAKNPLRPGLPSNPWAPLFNGKDLTGWKSLNPNLAKWTVADGALVGTGKPDILYTERNDYENFHLRAMVKIRAGVAGLLFRLPEPHVARGYAEQVTGKGNEYYAGGVNVLRDGPTLALSKDAKAEVLDPWLPLEIIAEGNRFKTFVNGKLVSDVTDGAEHYPRGSVGLRLWGAGENEIHFKNVEFKELPPTNDTDNPPETLIKAFSPAVDKPTATRADVVADKEGWSISAHKGASQLLVEFETPAPSLASGVLIFRAKLRCEKGERLAHLGIEYTVRGDAELRINSQGETNSVPSAGWRDFQARLRIDPKKTPDRIKGKVVIHGVANASIKDAELIHVADWAPLFNGKDLKGWTGDTKDWKVEKETLISAGKPALLRSEKLFQDFALRFEAFLEPAGGKAPFIEVFLHGRDEETDKETQQALIQFTPVGPGYPAGSGSHSVLNYNRSQVIKDVGNFRPDSFKPLQWNPVEIRSVNGRIEIFANGRGMAKFDIARAKAGYIGLKAYYAREWRFRNIEIQELPPTKK